MKIAMLRPSYKPDNSAGNHLAADLVDDLIEYGYEVEIIAPVSDNFNYEDVEEYEYPVHRVKSIFKGNGVLKRILKYIDTSLKMIWNLKKIEDVDIVFSHSMPPLIGPLSVIFGKVKKTPVIYWEQDIVSESIISTEITRNKLKQSLFYKVAKFMEMWTLKGSTHIITISEKFRNKHIQDGIDPKKISVIYNWIDTQEIHPIERDKNFLFDKYNLDKNKFYVTYCGNLGVPQNVEIMIDAAKMLEKHSDIRFVIFGGGSRENYIKEYIKKNNLKNLDIYPLEPLKNSKYVYSIGDIGLVIARTGTSNNGFPSKTWTIMAAGQTIISCFDLDSELSSFVEDSEAGIAIEPDNAKKLKQSILKVYNLKDKGKNLQLKSRHYVQENFSRKASTKKIIEIFSKYEQ